MTRKLYEIDGKLFLKCSMCGQMKEMTNEFWYKSKIYSTGYYSRCKSCTAIAAKKTFEKHKEERREKYKKYYQENKEAIMLKRKSNNEKSREARAKRHASEKFKEYIKKYRVEHRDELKKKAYERQNRGGRRPIHSKTMYVIKKLGIRPSVCPICGRCTRVEAHHPDYNVWYEIVRACNKCHQRIHNGRIECPRPIDIRTKKE